jgi:hypothetical protein
VEIGQQVAKTLIHSNPKRISQIVAAVAGTSRRITARPNAAHAQILRTPSERGGHAQACRILMIVAE